MACNQHPLYRAIRKPKSDCQACWKFYNQTHKVPKPKLAEVIVKDEESPKSKKCNHPKTQQVLKGCSIKHKDGNVTQSWYYKCEKCGQEHEVFELIK